MWEYLVVLFLGFWLGIAIFLYISCYWVEEILDLPAVRDADTGAMGAGREQPSASGAHARLKRLVQRVIEEAMALPALAYYTHHHKPADAAVAAFDAKTYEDLLATAILNKVIERYQTESTGGRSGGASSGIHSASASPTPSTPSSSSTSTPPDSPHTPPSLGDDDDEDERSDSEWEQGGVRKGVPEVPRRVPFPEFGGDIIHYSESFQELDDQNLEELSGSDLQAVDGSWEENWLFQKKKVKTLQSVPVPMLVPNSNAYYKAMIGDRDADDTTDLSDAATDSEDELEYKSDIGKVIYSKSVIGGKTPTNQLLTIDTDNEANPTKTDIEVMSNGNVENHSNDSQSILQDMDSSMEVQEVTAEFKSSNDSVIVVDTDSGPLPKAEFAVDEIHRINPNNINVGTELGVVSTVNDTVLKENASSLTNHQQDGEYEEAIAKPVQRYADSLRKQHFPNDTRQDLKIPTNTENIENDLIPGSIADRERKKWLNYVEMPNNPYSAEAIQKRLSNRSSSAIFDSLGTKSNIDDNKTNNLDKNNYEKCKEKSPSPKILKDVLAEEVPQYKRYGRDYYINEAKRSAGARKANNLSSASSLCSIPKATSLDQFDTNDFTSPVSVSSSLSDLEATALHHNIVRAVLSPRNASPNFAINPIYENLDKSNCIFETNDHDDFQRPKTDKYDLEIINNNINKHDINVSCKNRNLNKGGDGYVKNDDIVRLQIPAKPEITEDTFETFGSIRRSGTVRSDVFRPRVKRRTGLNFSFGGSLRLHKNFKSDLW